MTNRKSPLVKLGAGALVLFGALGVTACSNQPGESNQSIEDCNFDGTTLRVAHADTSSAAVAIAKTAIEKKYSGLTVEAVLSSAANYTEMAQQIIADKAAGIEIDAAQIGNDQVRLFVDTYQLPELDSSVLADSFDERYLEIGKLGGKQYAVPFQVSVPGMYVNLDLFKKAGLDPEKLPNNLEEILEAGRALKAVTPSNPITIGAGPSTDDWYVHALVESAGGTYTKQDGSAGFDSEEGRKALEFYKAGAAEELLLHVPDSETYAAFLAGQSAILFGSSAAVALIDTNAAGKFDWNMKLMPTSESPVYGAGGNVWIGLSTDSCRSLLANEFIANVVAPDSLFEALKAHNYLPVDTKVREALIAQESTHPIFKQVIQNTDFRLSPRGAWPGTNTPEVQYTVADLVEKVMLGNDISTELTAAVEKINKIVGK